MKRLTLGGLLLLCCLTTWAQKEVVLRFRLRNFPVADTISLSWGANNKSMSPLITSITPKENEDIIIPLNEPRLIRLTQKGYAESMEILASPGETITISGRWRQGSRRQNNPFDRLDISGAGQQEEFVQLIDSYNAYVDSVDAAVKSEYNDVFNFIARSKSQNNEQAIADMYRTQHGRNYVDRVISSYNDKNSRLQQVILKQKDSFMGPLLMLKLIGRLDRTYRELYDQLSDNAKQTYYGREVKDEVYPPTMTGDLAPTVSVKNTEGADKILSFVHHGNRYLLLDFWASWCEPCRKEVPGLKRLYEQYHAKGLDIIGISVDQNAEDWKQALEELEEPWCNYIDQNRQSVSEYKVQYIPSIFILDSSGTIIAEKLRGKELEDYIDNLFSKEE